GGVERLRRRMQEAPAPAAPAFVSGSHGRRFAVGIAAAATAAVGISAVWLEREVPSQAQHARQAQQALPTSGLSDAPELDRLLGRTREVELSVTVDGREVTLAKLPSTDPRVRIYALE